MTKKLTCGMVGGDLSSFIGNVHRCAMQLDPRVRLVSGCFSRHADKNAACGEQFDIDPSRLYTDWREMAKAEAARGEDKIDFVSVCTPNYVHYEVCREFLLAGVNVVCEKPLCFEISEAEELCRLAKERGLVFAVTYTYTGYNMVKVMRQMIARGDIGDIVSVSAEYVQDWLLDELSHEGDVNASIWRTDPKFTGIGNTVGDIGTHIENIVHYLTGLRIKRLCATVDRYGKKLDYNDNILVEYENGVHGSYWCSQVTAGKLNGLKVGIFGTKGALEWEQHYPDYVRFTSHGEAPQTLSKGCAFLDVPARAGARLPSGHPEGFYCAFANIYRNIATTLIKRKAGETPTEDDLDFQTVENGLDGVKFVHAVIESGNRDSAWVKLS